MKFVINYHTGDVDREVTGTLEDAKRIAEDCAAFTEAPISIHDAETYEEITRRTWWPLKLKEEDEQENPIIFGDEGFYGDWQ